MNVYCLMCRIGLEQQVANLIELYAPEYHTIFPVKIISEKRNGQATLIEKPLIPGYIFLYSDRDLLPNIYKISRHFFKYLQTDKSTRQLFGDDKVYADWIYSQQGQIVPSKILMIGVKIQVVEGPLKDTLGTIVKLDKHKRRVWVKFNFEGQHRIISLGAEFIDTIT